VTVPPAVPPAVLPAGLQDLLRECAPQVLAVVVRRYGDFEACEDAVQEALIAAARDWPATGVPAHPRNWLITVAGRRRVELLRNETARRRREEAVWHEPAPQVRGDDELALLLLCCHPALSVPAQVTLTLRAVGGLSTAEIARALLLPEATVGQRISRAKQRIRDTGTRFELPSPEELGERLTAVRHVLYLIFNEGYTASSGDALNRVELTREAIRLTRQLHRLVDDGEVAGLLALMLLTDARRPARTGPEGNLVPLAEQDRRRWDVAMIAEGVGIVTRTLAQAPIGPLQLQAAIAAVHDEAARAEDTDWPQILALYGMLHALAPSPMVTLNRIVARAMVDGPAAGLAALDEAAGDAVLARHHRTAAVRAHLLELAGDRAAAREQYRLAARHTLSRPEQRYLESRAARL
jgi:RNA polymerase sigma factor (sigma-70 family)